MNETVAHLLVQSPKYNQAQERLKVIAEERNMSSELRNHTVGTKIINLRGRIFTLLVKDNMKTSYRRRSGKLRQGHGCEGLGGSILELFHQ